jgi:phospholipid/cholesterol/gamma-HCH transport system substrate-binding protein
MAINDRGGKSHPLRWAAGLFAVIIGLIVLTGALFSGTFRSYVSVTLTSDRAGLVMESGGKVKMRGVEVGRVASILGGGQPVSLKLELDPDQIRYIPANVQAQIEATTAFGAKYVDLIYPEHPSPSPIRAGAVLHSRNVSTEVNTVFENLVGVTRQIEPAKLNAVLAALAEGVRGQGEVIGQATSDANQVLQALNERNDTLRQNWQSFKGFNDAYAGAADNIIRVLDALSTTSSTITQHSSDLDAMLLSIIGLSHAGIDVIGSNRQNLVDAVNKLEPTTDLLLKYSPIYACTLQGATKLSAMGDKAGDGGNGRTAILDATILLGNDLYQYPDNLPVVAAKGGPGGKPSCGSLPDASKNFPVRQLITNTGWGTGTDIRVNPGIGHPCYVDYLPVTRAVPQQPSIRKCLPGPAPGPIPYPGAPPYGAALYGPGGTPLWPGLPSAPPPAPETPAPAPQVGTAPGEPEGLPAP